jgi:hypothetical protein
VAAVLALAGLLPALHPTPAAAAPSRPWPISAYDGLGAWVDWFDWGGTNPAFTVASVDTLANRGVHTIYLQGARSTGPAPLDPARQRAIIDRAHQRGMLVVTWFLPTHEDPAGDRARGLAIAEQLPVDGLSIDIESSAVADPAERSRRLIQLVTELDAALPGPIGALTPTPVGMEINSAYWPGFPWVEIGQHTDVWQPMLYWTYRPEGTEWAEPRHYVSENIKRVRALSNEPFGAVHVVGDASLRRPVSPAEIEAMWLAASEEGAVGASTYDVGITPASHWPILSNMTFTAIAPLPAFQWDVQGFVQQQYADLLRRSGDPGGIVYWSRAMKGGFSPTALTTSIADGPEYADVVYGTVSLYPAILGRRADVSGQGFWLDVRRGGWTRRMVADEMLKSQEFAGSVPPDDSSFVKAIYNRGLGRDPEPAGLAYWQQQLAAGRPRSDVVFAIIGTAEFDRRNGPGIRVNALYASLLERAPDAGGAAYFEDQVRRGRSVGAVASAIVGSDEYKARILRIKG